MTPQLESERSDSDGETEEDIELIYEKQSWKVLIPQVVGAVIATSFHMLSAMSISFSGVLIPELEKPDAKIKATIFETSWIASVPSLALGTSSIIAGLLIDHFGRLNTMRLSIIPYVIGWAIVASANCVFNLIIGRFLIGFGIGLSAPSAGIYMGEISWPKYRASLQMLMSISYAIGIELMYFKILFMTWRNIAWSLIFYCFVAVILTFFLHESPSWLVKKGFIGKAKKSLTWIHKYQNSNLTFKRERVVTKHLTLLKQESNKERKDNKTKVQTILAYFRHFLNPKSYRPTGILLVLFIIQEFSGHYVVQAYLITILQKVGANIDASLTSNIVTGMNLIIAFVNVVLVRKFGRKPLLITSCLGGASCLFISGIFTKLIDDDIAISEWFPVTFLFFYIAFLSIGLGPLPWMITYEIMPLDVRGVLTGLLATFSTCLMFVTIYSYRLFEIWLSSAGVQFFYASVAFIGSIFVYFYLPETKGKTLLEIQKNFE